MANEKLAKELIVKLWDATNGTYNTVARCTGYNLEINKETVDVTSFDSAGWKEYLVDLKDFSISGDGLVVRTAASGYENYEDLLTSLVGSDSLLVVQLIDPDAYTDATDGTLYNHEVGNVYLTALSLSGSVGDKQTYSFTMQGSGKLTHVVAKFDTGTEAGAASASYSEGDVVLVIDQIADDTPTENRGYYERNAAVSTTFATAWDAYTI